jgi:sialate O-acetylesterase
MRGFTFAGADGKFVHATAVITGDTGRVSSPFVAAPVAVRFAWSRLPDINFSNAGQLPASPFKLRLP